VLDIMGSTVFSSAQQW